MNHSLVNTISERERIIVTIAICLVALIFVLDYTIVNVALPYITGGMGTSPDQGAYTITFFAIGNAITLPMAGWFSKRFGIIKTLVVSALLFTLFSWFCSIAFDLLDLVIFRFLQGASAGPLIPLSQAILTSLYPKEELGKVMSIFANVTLVGPVLGPILGGYFCINFSWRWAFYINIPIGIISAAVIWTILRGVNGEDKNRKLDWTGAFLLFIGMIAFQLMLDKGQQWDWFSSTKIWICAILAFLGISYLILWCLYYKNPLINLALLKNRGLLVSTVLIGVFYSTYMGTVILVPLWVQTFLGYNALWAGLAVAPMGIPALFLNFAISKFVDRTGETPSLILGAIFMILSSIYSSYFTTYVDFFHLAMSRLILGFGIAFFVIPILRMPSQALAEDSLEEGLSIFHTTRNFAGAVGTSLYLTLFQRRLSRQHMNLASNFNEFRPESVEYLKDIESYGIKGKSSLALANDLIDQQASAISFDEVNFFMSFLLLFLILVSIVGRIFKKEPASVNQLTSSH